MRTRLIEIAGGFLLGLVLMGASLGAMVIVGRLVETHVEVAR